MYFPVSPTSASGPAMPRTMREFIRAASTSPTKQPRSHSPSRRDSLAASFASSLSPCTSPRLAQLQESPRRVFTTGGGSNGNHIAHTASCDVNMSVEDRRTFSDEANSLLCPRPASAGAAGGGVTRTTTTQTERTTTTTTAVGRNACHRLPRPCHMSGSQTDYEDNYAGASSSSCVSSQRVLTTEERTRRERSLQRESDRCSGVSASLRVTNTASNLSTAEYGGEGEGDANSRGSTPCLSVSDTRAGTRMGRSESFIAVAANAAAPDARAITPASNPCEEVRAAVGGEDGSGGACVRTVCTPPHEAALQSATPRLFATSSAVQKSTNAAAMQPMLGLSRFPSSPQHTIREQLVQDAAQLASSYRSNSPARLSASSSSFSSLFTNDLTTQGNNTNTITTAGANYASGAMPVGATPLMWRPQAGPAFPLPRAPPRLGSTNAQLACAPFAGNAATQSAPALAVGSNIYLASPSPRPPQMAAEFGATQTMCSTETAHSVKTGQEKAAVHAECHMAMPWAPQLATSATHDITPSYTSSNNSNNNERMMRETEADMPHPRRFHDAMTMEHIEQLIARGRPRVEGIGVVRPGGTLAQAIQAALPETSSLITTTTANTETSSFTMYTSETGSTRRAVSPSRPRASPSPPRTSLADSDECESEGEGSLREDGHVSEVHRNTPATAMTMIMPLSSNPVVANAANVKRKGMECAVSGACAPPQLVNAVSASQPQRTQYSSSSCIDADAAAARKYASTTRLADRVAAEEETLPPPSTGPIVTSTSRRLHSRPPPVLSTTANAIAATNAVGRRTIRFIEPCVTSHTQSPARAEEVHHTRADNASHTLTSTADMACMSNSNGALLNAPQEEGGRLSDLSVYEPLDEEPQIDEVRYLREEMENENADAEALAAARRHECAQRLCAHSQQARDEELHTHCSATTTTTNTTAMIHTPSHGSWQSSSKATTEFEEVDAEAMRCGWMTLRDSSPPVRDRSMAPHELLEERRRHTATAGADAATMMMKTNTQTRAHDM